MSEPFLILHKVRGEPAFDVAEKTGEDDIWIIPTSGHRAYPSQWWSLDLLLDGVNSGGHIRALPEGLPDHYSVNDRPTTPKKLTLDLKELGL